MPLKKAKGIEKSPEVEPNHPKRKVPKVPNKNYKPTAVSS